MLGHNRAPVSDWQLARGNYNFDDDAGAVGAFTIFTVTGDVLLKVVPAVCKDSVVGGVAPTSTIELGVAGNTAVFIAQIADADDLLVNELWNDATPTTTVEQLDLEGANVFVVSNGQDVIFTVGDADLTAGDIDFYCLWRPLSAGATVVAA